MKWGDGEIVSKSEYRHQLKSRHIFKCVNEHVTAPRCQDRALADRTQPGDSYWTPYKTCELWSVWAKKYATRANQNEIQFVDLEVSLFHALWHLGSFESGCMAPCKLYFMRSNYRNANVYALQYKWSRKEIIWDSNLWLRCIYMLVNYT